MSKLVSLEMAPIRCNVVVPGPVHTEIWDSIMPKENVEEFLKTIVKTTTIGPVASPHDT